MVNPNPMFGVGFNRRSKIMFRNYCVLRSPEPAPANGGGINSNQAIKKDLTPLKGKQKTSKAPKVPAQRDVRVPPELDIQVGMFNIKDLKFTSGPVPASLKDNAVRLLTELDKFCTSLGVTREAVNIISGYRSSTYNEKVGGATTSKHMTAEAVDIAITGFSVKELFKQAYNLSSGGDLAFRGIGLYDTWIHVDVRKVDDIISWFDTSDKNLLTASKNNKKKFLFLLLG